MPWQPVFGFAVAGRDEAAGSAVTRFRVGDRVVASRDLKLGCHAERVVVAQEGAIAPIPESLGDQEAVAPCFGGMTALHYFERGKLAAGESLLVNGASGGVGAMAVQLAKHTGAEVTAVCSADHADLVAGLGADHVIDYATEDFTRNGRRYDVIMDTHGNAPYARVKDSLRPGGRFLMVVGDLWQTLGAARHKNIVSGKAKTTAASFGKLMELAGSGELKPVIDSVYPFEQIAEAHRRVDTGHKAGSVVVTFTPDSSTRGG
jgi:NADPH:quinone reductase-like Zn-dependent oxidoreductase